MPFKLTAAPADIDHEKPIIDLNSGHRVHRTTAMFRGGSTLVKVAAKLVHLVTVMWKPRLSCFVPGIRTTASPARLDSPRPPLKMSKREPFCFPIVAEQCSVPHSETCRCSLRLSHFCLRNSCSAFLTQQHWLETTFPSSLVYSEYLTHKALYK
ncbi:hypothetical protein J6590_026507 [Homalodisca vitripennis]|nr:hypothetical protein J6590_026507 [Homalodisca vitripennis]